MATVTHRIATASTSNVTSYASGAFTPSVGDLLIAFVVASGTVDPGVMIDSMGLGFALAGSATKNAGADTIYCFVSQRKVTTSASMTVTFNCPNDAATGCIIFVASVSGLSRVGPAALRQLKVVNNNAASTPAITFSSSCLTGNPTLGVIGNATNPATLTPPTGWTEQSDTGYATPTTGGEYVSRDSGFTGTTITWGSASASAWGGIIVEVDTTVQPNANIFPNTSASQPNVVSHVLTGIGNEAVNNIKVGLPNTTSSGNLGIIDILYDASVSITSISDDVGNSYTQAKKSTGVDVNAEEWYCPNLTSGGTRITVTFSGVLNGPNGPGWAEFLYLEVAGIVSATPVNASNSNSSAGPTLLSSGGVTTTGATFIHNFIAQSYAFPLSEATLKGITPSNNCTLGAVDPTVKIADQWVYQASGGTYDPIFYPSDEPVQERHYHSICVAYSVDSTKGTLPSSTDIRVVKMMHVHDGSATGATTLSRQFATVGNVRVMASSHNSTTYNITVVGDDGTGYTRQSPASPSNFPQLFDSVNNSASPTNVLGWQQANASTWMIWYDIANAAVSPQDGTINTSGAQSVAGADINDAPDLAPSTSTVGVMLAILELGTGPPSGPATTGMLMDSIWAPSMTDGSQYDSGDGYAHYYYNSNATVAFNWHMANAVASSWDTFAIAYKQATVPSTTGSVPYMRSPGGGFGMGF